jgi:hypothetical protein
MRVFRNLLSKNGLSQLFGINFRRPLFVQDLPVGATSKAMLQYLNFNPTMKIGIYDLRRANDSFYFAAVGAGEKILERTGENLAVKYARSRLERHLKLTDHSENIADAFYNQAGVNDQLVDFGKGFPNAFAESKTIDWLFEADMSPKELAERVRFSHRGQGLRAIRRWVDEGLISSPIRVYERFYLFLCNIVAWFFKLFSHESLWNSPARR